MRSMVGVGITPPKVPGAPKPWSSVIMSSTLGAPLGGTTRGGHQGVDSEAFSLITPPNFGSGDGSWLPGIVVVALGDPGTPVICWADTQPQSMARTLAAASTMRPIILKSRTPMNYWSHLRMQPLSGLPLILVKCSG